MEAATLIVLSLVLVAFLARVRHRSNQRRGNAEAREAAFRRTHG